jgi:phage tail sheath protein FI
MAASDPTRKFRFVSPGVFIDEIDNSRLPSEEGALIGPVVIGRAKRGPASRPVLIKSQQEFVEIFGEQVPGTVGGDVWREGNLSSPMYGTYAAQAWLASNSPLTYIRLLGEQSDNATVSGSAGWRTALTPNNAVASNGGAYGLFIIDSGSAVSALTGALAAVWYLESGAIVLSGTAREVDGVETPTTGSAILVKSTGANREFRAIVYNSAGTVVENTNFNFSRTSEKYIRKVFNTNPILTNSDIVASAALKTYWLGETYERHLSAHVTSSTAGSQFGVILGLEGPSTQLTYNSAGYFKFPNQPARTGWVISQDLAAQTSSFDPRNQQKLFRLESLYGGEWDSKNLKVSIQDIKRSNLSVDEYGTFTILIRDAKDNDLAPKVLERFSNVNINPASPDFVARRVGDKTLVWDDTKKKYDEHGVYDNNSRHIRIEMNDDVMAGMVNPAMVPFGFLGPLIHNSFAYISGSTTEVFPDETDAQTAYTASVVVGAGDIPHDNIQGTEMINVGTQLFTGSFEFPKLQLRVSASDAGTSQAKHAYYGVDTNDGASSKSHDLGYIDYNRVLPASYKDLTAEGAMVKHAYTFTLDDVSGSHVVANDLTVAGVYVSGSRANGTSISSVATNGWSDVLSNGHNRFTMPLVGGFDGLDVTEKDPFRNSSIASSPSEETDHVYYTLKRAIDAVRDAEVVEHNLAVAPGVTNEALTGHLVRTCEGRADSLAVIDPLGGFKPNSENTDAFADRVGDTDTIVSNLKARGLNSSYGATYDPWVQVRDTVNNAIIFMPPSVVALGTYASSEKQSALWFAPAGFTRGGLSANNSAGMPVVGVTRRLDKDERDKLYEVGVNPIAQFPAEGIVVFGQKTLQETRSAVDRVNVRRLMNHLKKQISIMAAQTLFDQNIEATWARFKGRADRFLASVAAQYGIVEYDVVLDETTTTPDLIDRNIMYGIVKVKPARAIEFIGLDFIITNSGASFDD